MTKAKEPEEFFEVLRSAKREKELIKARPESKAGAEPVQKQPEPAAKPPPKSPIENKFPFSVFAENEPTITLRRSTLIFSVIVVAVLLFISYALGKRVSRARPPQKKPAVKSGEIKETRRPALPEELRNKSVICMKVFDHTQNAGPANARAYREFLNVSPDAAFIKSRGKKAFIISHDRKLIVCIGPFDGLTSPHVNWLLPKLRKLRHNGVQQFANAEVKPLPHYAKLFQ